MDYQLRFLGADGLSFPDVASSLGRKPPDHVNSLVQRRCEIQVWNEFPESQVRFPSHMSGHALEAGERVCDGPVTSGSGRRELRDPLMFFIKFIFQ